MWKMVDDGTVDGEYPAVLTRTFVAECAGGKMYRTETVWPGNLVSEAICFVPKKKTSGILR